MPATVTPERVRHQTFSLGDMLVQDGVVAENGRRIYGHAESVPEGMSIDQAMDHVGMNYTVVKRPCHSPGGVELRNQFYLGREDDEATCFGPCKKRYQVAQNTEVFEVAKLMAEQGVKAEAGGLIDEGAKAWLLLRMPEDYTVAGEPMDPFVLAYAAHDGQGSLTFANTPIRPYCTNVFPLIFRGSGDRKVHQVYKVRHTGDMSEKIREAGVVLGRTRDYLTELATMGDSLARKRLNDRTLKTLLETLYPDGMNERQKATAEERRALVKRLVTEAPNLENHHGTAWAFVNAVGEAADWDTARSRDRINRLTWTAPETKIKNRALALALDA